MDDGSLGILLLTDTQEHPEWISLRAIECDKCQTWCHIENKGCKVPFKPYKELTIEDQFEWKFPWCINDIHRPIHNMKGIDINAPVAAFQETKAKVGYRGVRIAHLNVAGWLSKTATI